MTINLLGKNAELEYSFNSFKYMEDFDISELANLEKTPFKIFGIAETMLIGALNHDRKVIYTEDQVADYLAELAIEGELFTLVEGLITLLEASEFFKGLTREKKAK